jgi:hypothetical protein
LELSTWYLECSVLVHEWFLTAFRYKAQKYKALSTKYQGYSRLKKTFDDHGLVIYHRFNTGKEVILKYMSSYHSEVAAA